MVWHFGDRVGVNFFGDSFESGGWQGRDHSVFGEARLSGIVDEDLSGGSDATKAGGQVDSVTQHGVIEAFFGTHAACHDGTCGDADAYFEGKLGLAV